MFKRIVAVFVSVSLFVVLFSSCSKPTLVSGEPGYNFSSEEEMAVFFDGVWYNGTMYCLIGNNKVSYFGDYVVEYALDDLISDLDSNSYLINNITFDAFYNNYYLTNPDVVEKTKEQDFKFEIKKSAIFDSLGNPILMVDEYGNVIDNNGVNYSRVEMDSYSVIRECLQRAYNDAIKTYQETKAKAEFNKKYTDLPTSKEVQYDKYGHIFKKFTISGTAELDDYYNWEYRNYKYGYFCIRITPVGANYYSDAWYVYAKRSDYQELYDALLSGNCDNITLVCSLIFVDTGSDNMATLEDYFIF